MFNWILTKLGLRTPIPTESATESSTTKSIKPDRAVVLCGPECDDNITPLICNWLGGLKIPQEITTYSAIGSSVDRNELTQILKETSGSRTAVIFVGHGAPDALLGPPLEEGINVEIDGVRFSVLYDESVVGLGPDTLFAFCCYSGSRLGDMFVASGNRTFLGYTKKLPLDLDNEQCQRIWESLLHNISLEIINDGVITKKHEDLLRELYDEAYDFFRNGEGRKNDRNITNLMYILRHKKILRRL